jgi:hypothetical protein
MHISGNVSGFIMERAAGFEPRVGDLFFGITARQFPPAMRSQGGKNPR